MPGDLWNPKENYGMPCSFGSLQDVARASQPRAHHRENAAHGGLKLEDKARQLRAAAAASDGNVGLWAQWRATAIPVVLLETVSALANKGITTELVQREAERHGASFQGAARSLIKAAEKRPPHFRIRHKLERWRLPRPPRVVADRF